MTFTILAALVLSKIKGYRLLPALKTWPLYPFYASELLYCFLQFNIFIHNYSFIKYAGAFKTLHIMTLLVPIVVFQLYKPALAGSFLVIIGTILNKIVIQVNDGKMPVFPSLSYLTGYASPDSFSKDTLHILGNSTTKLPFLADFLDSGFSILSIGDLFIHSFFFVVIFFSIQAIHLKNRI